MEAQRLMLKITGRRKEGKAHKLCIDRQMYDIFKMDSYGLTGQHVEDTVPSGS